MFAAWNRLCLRVTTLELEVTALKEERARRAIEWETVQIEVARLLASLRTAQVRAEKKQQQQHTGPSLAELKLGR